VSAWWFPALPRARVALLRTAAYLFVVVDVLVTTPWVADRADVPGSLYQPLLIGRVLPLPTPGPALVHVVMAALLAAALTAATGRAPRLAGWAVFALYAEWMVIAFSYGKVDHDRFAFLVALAVLPTVGRAHWRDGTRDEAAGWALRMVQVAVVATYALSVVAKLRFGGLAWLDSATLLRAVIRRGALGQDFLVDHPELLHAAQYLLVAFELGSPLLLARGRLGRAYLAVAFAFHAVTFATIHIVFLPHVVAMLAFLPLERLTPSGASPPSTAARARPARRPLARRPAAV
jgi:hypothetical protein